MSGEGSLFDVPPAAFGRFRVLHQIGAGSTGPVFRGEDPESGAAVAIKAVRLDLPPERAHEVADALAHLVSSAPRHPALAAPLAAGLSGVNPYLVTMLVPGQSLDVALRDFGPAAIGDLLPRLQAMADALDLGAERALFHGALHPRDIMVSAEDSIITGLGVSPILARAGARIPARRPYTAPEVAEGHVPSAAADQFSFAAIAFEWMTGRRPAGPADAPLEFPGMPGIDRAAMAAALTAALARKPADRHRTVREFVDAISGAVLDEDVARAAAQPPRRPASAVMPRLPIEPPDEDDAPEPPGMVVDDSIETAPPDPPRFASLTDDESEPESRPGLRLVTPLPPLDDADAESKPADQVAWQGSSLAPPSSATYGVGALVVAAMLGVVAGFGAAYVFLERDGAGLARPAGVPLEESSASSAGTGRSAPGTSATRDPRANESASSRAAAPAPSAAASPSPPKTPSAGTVAELTPPPKATAPAKPAPAPAPPPAGKATVTEATTSAAGSLLIRSVPSGSAVTVDGVKKGTTPVTVRGLQLGTRQILVQRTGYVPAERTVTLTSGRPSRSIDVRLAVVPPRPARGSTTALPEARSDSPEAATGSLVIESRPTGAQVTINGVVRGTTPLTIGSMSPGVYEVMLQLSGYQPFTTRVTVAAGARARAAGSLVLRQEQE